MFFNDIQFAAYLINYFVLKYQNFYGRRHLTYNLHSHLHLPLQVFLFGPLYMVSCFPFEGFFKICNGLYIIVEQEQLLNKYRTDTLISNPIYKRIRL
jgi:hypothetical protein